MHSNVLPKIVKPLRSFELPVEIEVCGNQACLSEENFKNLIKNQISTESYIKQLERLLKELAEFERPTND